MVRRASAFSSTFCTSLNLYSAWTVSSTIWTFECSCRCLQAECCFLYWRLWRRRFRKRGSDLFRKGSSKNRKSSDIFYCWEVSGLRGWTGVSEGNSRLIP